MDSQDVESSKPKSDSKSTRKEGTKRLLRRKQTKDVNEDTTKESSDEGSTQSEQNSKVRIKRKRRAKPDVSNQEEKAFKCPECPKQYSKRHFLERHKFEHSDERPWECTECKIKFVSSVRFKEHCKTHGILKPFQCTKCEGSFTTVEVLKVHDRTHTGERPYPCTKCNKTFKQNANLQDHLRKHNNDRAYICGTCEKSFNVKGDLTKHLLLHTGERPYRCTLCPMSFPGVSNLNRHILVHTGLKPFSCQQCRKSFSRKEKLKEHERTHSGDKPFVCPECGKSFSDSGNFSNHKRTHKDPDHPKSKKYPTKKSTSPKKIPFPVINISENSLIGINLDSEAQSPASLKAEQKHTFTLSLPNPFVCFLDGSTTAPMMCRIGNASDQEVSNEPKREQPLFMQLQSLSNSELMAEAGETGPSEVAENTDNSSGTIQRANNSVDQTITQEMNTATAVAEENFSAVDKDTSLTGTKMQDTGIQIADTASSNNESCTKGNAGCTDNFVSISISNDDNSLIASPSKLLASLQSICEQNIRYCSSPEKEGKIPLRIKSDFSDDVNAGNLFSNSTASSGFVITESYIADSNQNAGGVDHGSDLAQSEDLHSYTYQPGYIVLPPDNNGEQNRLGEILLATPTKSYPSEGASRSPASFLCQQVLVTPEHASLSKHAIDRGVVRPRALQL
eukprot:Seg271.8 transcript_id=Seg271.8/GoldUCD/mRNA.D3Y31 product="Zinc finger protein 629" protein_id=Seg271.8/GoldUCD/D3Y31